MKSISFKQFISLVRNFDQEAMKGQTVPYGRRVEACESYRDALYAIRKEFSIEANTGIIKEVIECSKMPISKTWQQKKCAVSAS